MAGDVSSAESSHFVFLVRPFFNLFGNNDEMLMTLVIRKTAHFLEYAVLMALGKKMVDVWFSGAVASWPLLGVIWVLAPCVDEAIQLMTPGRSGQLADVLIDMSGGVFGLAVYLIVRIRMLNARCRAM